MANPRIVTNPGAMLAPIALAFLLALSAQAPSTASCRAMDTALPAALSSWPAPAPASGTVVPGQAVNVAMRPMADVHLAVPGRAAREGNSTAAVMQLTIATGGAYGVALDQGAWIDVVASGRSLESAAHGHGPYCSTIRKIVNFQLAPGTYSLQLSGTSAASVRLLVFQR